MNVHAKHRGIVNVIALDGGATPSDVRAIRDAVADAIEAGTPFLVFDLSGLNGLDSACLGELVACKERLRKHGGSLKIVATGECRDLFAVSELDRVLEIHDDEEQALDSFLPADATAGVP